MVELIAQIMGILGMLLAVISFQCRENRKFFALQAASGAAFAANFFLLGSTTAAFLNLLNILRGYACGFAPKKWRTALCGVSAVLYIVATVLTYDSWLSVLVLLAQLVGTAVMWLNNGTVIRIAQLCFTSPAWLIHNILCFSLGGILCESFNLISVIVSMIRYGIHGFSDADAEKTER